MVEKTLTPEQRNQILEYVTEAMVRVVGEEIRGAVWVLIDQIPADAWGVGGRPLSAVDSTSAGGLPDS